MRLGYPYARGAPRLGGIRFNEAEAHAPRIPGGASGDAAYGDQASMRPRRMRLGYFSANHSKLFVLARLQ